MWSGFRKEVWAKLPADRIDGGLWSNHLNALNALIYLNYQMEINRWKFAVEECAKGHIPTILHANEFQDMLQDVHTALESSTFKPAIPLGKGISYYNIKLTSCMFTETDYAVRILLPVSVRGNK